MTISKNTRDLVDILQKNIDKLLCNEDSPEAKSVLDAGVVNTLRAIIKYGKVEQKKKGIESTKKYIDSVEGKEQVKAVIFLLEVNKHEKIDDKEDIEIPKKRGK